VKGSWCRWNWCWWVRTNQADHKSMWQQFWILMRQCSGLSLNRQPCPRNEGGEQFSPCTSLVMDIDGQQRDIIGPGRDSHLPADHSYRSGFPTMHVNLTLSFCDWGRRSEPKLLFPGDTLPLKNQCKIMYNCYVWRYTYNIDSFCQQLQVASWGKTRPAQKSVRISKAWGLTNTTKT
jgi:hypothetical protein